MRAIASPIPDEPPVTSALGIGGDVSHRTRRPPGSGGLRRAGRGGRGRSSPSGRRVRPPGAPCSFSYTRRVTQPTLTSLAKAGGCAAKYSAARLEELLAGIVPARRRRPARRARPRRRRGRLPPRRRARARLHGRLLPAGRRRPADLRRDRRDERAQRRLRDGRACRCSRSRSRRSRRSSRPRCSARCWPARPR